MLKRVLEDITNVRNTNIKVTIKKEEVPLRREILSPYLEYAEAYYNHLNRKLAEFSEILREYDCPESMCLYTQGAAFYAAHKEEDKYAFGASESMSPASSLLGNLITAQPGRLGGRSFVVGKENEFMPNVDEKLFSLPLEEVLGKSGKDSGAREERSGPQRKRKCEESPGERRPRQAEEQGVPDRVSAASPERVDCSSSEEVELESGSARRESPLARRNREISIEMRTTLIEWMYDVKTEFSLNSTSYQTAVRIVDKYALVGSLSKKKYQLVGAVSLFVANKLVECESRGLMAYLDVCDGAYTRSEFLGCERDMLMKIGGCLNFLLPMHLIKEDRFLLGNSLTEYASEAVLLDASYACLLPKELSAFIEANVVACLGVESSLARLLLF
ncbi:uncharacterized protein NEMAJ01_1449 [Nematocida major]|uniref:uncharacterized protein n=1 Tax=Nematocida major TaxID=1912982 RepID=UPI002007E2DE|nr:uncharacterized protein NEMAJ01_1449 [Nematocida major]KAH9386553.1 hypothetical protein NEMAJ01_1449 [Nematocida major]